MDEPYEVSSTTVAPIKAKEAINKIASTSKNLKIDQSKKMLLELRRLNANVVKSDFSRVEDEEDIRRHALAHLAKDERELRPTVIVTQSDTVLLSNKKTETRRQKRAPKRYSDYSVDDTEKEEEFEPPKKFKPKELIDEPFKTKAQHKDTGAIQEELKMLKEEVIKWIHVNVKLTKIEYLDELQPWCMIHNLYKCSCKAMIEPVITKKTDEIMETKSLNTKNNEGSKKEIFVETFQTIENNLGDVSIKDDLIDDCSIKFEEKVPNIAEENSRRVLPIDIEKSQKNVCEIAENIDLEDENKENAPKMEILNLSELVNGGIGPIYINVYDTKVNRLNPIFRSILNNRTALVYLDGLGYHLNMRKIDVMKLKFDKIKEELEHPVFIICPKNFNSLDDTAKIYDDFINLLFKDDSELIIQIRNKFVLKEVARIIEIVLQSVRKKIEIQIGSNPSDYVKEQLSLITRDRSNSNTSVSSADTSPLHFNGKMLEKAPSPGLNTEIMREFNKIFSMRMQRFCAIIRSNTLGLHPLDGYVNKFYIYKWSLLIKSFEEGLINIWQVRIKKETDNYFVYVITKTATPPIVNYVDHESIVNVKILPLSNTSIVIRMILLRVENSKTKNMTVLLFGCKGYFRICGLLNSKESYFEGVSSKPLKQTHPRLTAKIQKVYNIWYGLKKATSQNNNLTDSKNEHLVKEIETNDESSINVTASSNKIDNNIKQLSSKYKWFLFNISNDFSDIYIKQWKNYLSYKIIMEAIKRAKIKQQTIRILGPLNSAKDTPRIFALPRSPLNFKKGENLKMTENFLIFGPYLRNSNSNLLLMQNVDGKMFLRDDYEKRSNIQRESRTRCLWIYANSLKCVAETCIENIQPDWNRSCVNKL